MVARGKEGEAGGRRMVRQRQKEGSCDETVQYFDCGAEYTKLRGIKLYSTKCTHTQMSISKTIFTNKISGLYQYSSCNIIQNFANCYH